MANFKNGVFFNGSSPGSGKRLGNVKNDVIFNGSSPGSGKRLGNVKNGYVYDGSSPGSGTKVGRVKDYNFKGGENLEDVLVVAAYHFLIKKIF